MNCGKRQYETEELAVEALIGSRIRFQGSTAIAVYQCQDCGYWHLTSQGSIHPRLEEALKTGKIDREREISYWERKLR